MKKFIELAKHIIVMEDDAYLSGHPEWHEIVNEAKDAISFKSPIKALLRDNQDNYDMGIITTSEYETKKRQILPL